MATLVDVEGSSYRRAGARLFVNDSGVRTGSISGGCLEADVVARAANVARNGTPELVLYDTSSENDLVWGVGLGCHGVVRVLLEKVGPRPDWAVTLQENLNARRSTRLMVVWQEGTALPLGTRLSDVKAVAPSATGVFAQTIEPPLALTIFGAGDDAQPLARFATQLGWQVTVADVRAAFATKARFPEAVRLVVARADELVSAVAPEAGGAAVVMTHHYVHDVPVLAGLSAIRLAYVGLLGPQRRAKRIADDLRKNGAILSPEFFAHFHAPVGLDVGADGAEEVALSIVAEIRATLSGRDGRPLRERNRPIHD